MSIITTLSAPPSRSAAPASYVTDMDAWLAALPTMVTEINALSASDWFSVQGSATDTTAGTIALQGNDADYDDLSATSLELAGATPAFLLQKTDEGTDEKYWRFVATGVGLNIDGLNDAKTASSTAIRIGRTALSEVINSVSFFTSNAERTRIISTGDMRHGQTSTSSPGVSNTTAGVCLGVGGATAVSADSKIPLYVNRSTDDGTIISLRQDGTEEGSVTITGTTAALVGAHMSRWSQANGIIRRGTVMTNLDEMCVWRGISYTVPVEVEPAQAYKPAVEAQDAVYDSEGVLVQAAVEGRPETPAKEAVWEDAEHRVEYFGDAPDGAQVDVDHDGTIYAGTVYTEANEQLNKMAVSSVAGDRNVAGVFQGWDQGDTYGDMLCAMTGDFVIRIGAGVAVSKGDLLDSAGDGTARAQPNQDAIGPGTVAKVTSTHVVETYDDGSYLVPCVLMAC